MIPVAELKSNLEEYPDDALCEALEGIAIIDKDSKVEIGFLEF